jgi:hypothetical protein
MPKAIAAVLILFSFVFVSIVHACSGLDAVAVASLYGASKGPMMAGKPCDHAKPEKDICKSVRQRMLSTRAESIQSDSVLLSSTLPNLMPLGISVLLPPGSVRIEQHLIPFSSSKSPPAVVPRSSSHLEAFILFLT